MKLAGFKHKGEKPRHIGRTGSHPKTLKVWVNSKIKGDMKRRIIRHQETLLKELNNGKSYSEALRLARKAEHDGMTKHQIHVFEGKVGAIARWHGKKKKVKK